MEQTITTLTACLSESMERAVFEKLQEAIDSQSILKLQIEAEQNKARRLLSESNLGRRFSERTFDNFDSSRNKQAFEKAFAYAENFEDMMRNGKGLVFIGEVGTGKTHLAAAITNHVIKNYGIVAKFGAFVDLLEQMKKQFGQNVSDDQILDVLLSVPLVVLDDVGKERQSEWTRSILYQVVNSRYEAYKPMIFTSNDEPRMLEQNIGEATFSRLVEMCDFIHMNGADYRKQRLL